MTHCASTTSCTAHWMLWMRSVRPAGQQWFTEAATVMQHTACCDSVRLQVTSGLYLMSGCSCMHRLVLTLAAFYWKVAAV